MINPSCFDFIVGNLGNLMANSSFPSDMEDQYSELIADLEYLKIYMLCLAKWNNSSFEFVEESHIGFALEEAERKFRMLSEKAKGKLRISKHYFTDCDSVVFELLEKINQSKPKIREDCLNFLDGSFQCEFSTDELPEFMSSISARLHNLLDLKIDVMPDVKVQIESLEDNLDLFQESFEFTAKWCSSHEDLKDFTIHLQAWAWHAACLSLLYWVLDVKKENESPRMDVILSDLQKKISPSTLEVTRMYLAVLKNSKPSADDCFMAGKLVLKFVEFLKDNLQVDPEKDVIQMLFIDLIFLMTFLMDRPEPEMYVEEGKLIFTQANRILNDVASLISSLSAGEIKERISEESNFLLLDFLEKADTIKTKVRKLYAHLFLDPSSFNFPKINVFGFIDSLLEKLKEFCNHFPKHQIVMLHKELLFLRESNLKVFSIPELQNKHNDTRDLWTRIISVAYHAERAFTSFIYMKKSLWHDILCVSDVIEEIKLIKGEGKRIQDQHLCDIHGLNFESISNPLISLEANASIMGKVVGLEYEVEEIIDQLTNGSSELDIVSIVGMPGLGKTTLAKKVYSDPLVRNHFHKIAWCTISQVVNSRKILLKILSDVNIVDSDLYEKEEEDLAQMLQKCLRGQKYLIVMDDLWDVSAWDALKMSFPDDNNGSRIIFTSRILDVVVEAKSGCSPFLLNPLSGEECWELLENKLFGQASCPRNFVEIGKQIARSCKGLPLTVVLTAGLLKEKIDSMDWWKKVGERLESWIAKEGCKDILELSYKHLPESLKPCFLYFGLFPADSEIPRKILIQLWISEGFIPKHEQKSLEIVAEELLMDLVVRSLVIVAKTSSTGGIKSCCVHDLLHDFCMTKGEEENIFKAVGVNQVSYHPIPMAATYAYYRVSFQTKSWRAFLEHISPASFVHSLFLFQEMEFSNVSKLRSSCLPLANLKFLRVLNLEAFGPLRDFPEAISALILLRYLAFEFAAEDIPTSILRLKNLEILRTFGSTKYYYELPFAIWEMQKLWHVHLPCFRIEFRDDIHPLENVQSFRSPVIYYKEAKMFFRMIPKVRKLRCIFFMSPDQFLRLDCLSHLESLHVGYRSPELHSLPFHFPSTLKKLNCEAFRLPWSEISAISKLANLEVLKLYDSFRGKTWNVEDEEFLKLKFLKLETSEIEQWNASEESFPRLERLVVKILSHP